MTPTRWQEVKAVLGEALELDETAQRVAFVASACAQDTTLMREVNSLLTASRSDRLEACASEMRVGSTDIDDTSVGRRLGAYRIVRELGRGGMGAVYLAERADQEFTKTVAIKLLKRGTDTDEVLRRFRGEREILARLEHPNIARLLDAGTTDDGLPYFVMEYVVGARVTDYCFAQNLSVAERLNLFLKICSAVHFAHQNLVIHRDLKPANILVTAEGEPKLLDFGIAKLVSQEAGAFQLTLHDQQRLTPAYASPEQVRGDVITTVSDVYSLGALLYELLVGFSPHKFAAAHPSPTELWRVIGEQQAPRPSTAARDPHLRRKLRGDLDNILLTALRKEPARRYTGVGAFSEDIRRYLGDRPVRARPATIGYHARKFVRRNKVATLAGMLAVIALLAGTVVSVWNAERAQSEARRAERNFEDVRHLANSFLFEFHDAIAPLPGATSARQLVVGRALEYLDKLSREAAGNRALQLEVAEAYLKIGDVQGKPYTANLGDSSGALRSYAAAAGTAQPWAQREEGSSQTAARSIASRAALGLAAVQTRLKQVDEATKNSQRALEIGEQALRDRPANGDDWRRLLIVCHWGLGDAVQAGNHALRDPERHRASLEHYRRALPLAEQLVAANPDSIEDLRRLAKSCSRAALVAELGTHTGDTTYFDEGIALHGRAVELLDGLLQQDPQNALLRRSVADALIMKAGAHVLGARELDTALAGCLRALQMQEELAAADPANAEAQQDLAYAHYTTGRIHQLRGEFAAAQDDYERALRILDPLVRRQPDNVETRFDFDRAQKGLAEAAAALNGSKQR